MTNDYPAIPQKRREQYFKIINDHPNFSVITMQLYYLDDHMPPHQLDVALNWLIDNRIVGKLFVDWFHNVCAGSSLEMIRILLVVVNNSKENVRLIAGKNFKI